MLRKKMDVDVIKDVLQAALEAQPNSTFVQSLLRQYEDRGGLSKKQLEGLHDKASKIESIPVGKLATLEAIIMKKHQKYRSAPPPPKPVYETDDNAAAMVRAILEKYPQHKRVLFFLNKVEHKEPLNPTEMAELEKFNKILLQKKR